MAPRIPPLLPLPLQRRILRATLHRPPRLIHTSSPALLAKRPLLPSPSSSSYIPLPAPTALTALLSRLRLPASSSLHKALLTCLTHPSFLSATRPDGASLGSSSSTSQEESNTIETNQLLSSLGNSLLGLFTTEHLSSTYPELPTEALKSAVTALVGPRACISVAKELGLTVTAQKSALPNAEGKRIKGPAASTEGIVVRYSKERVAVAAVGSSETEGGATGSTGYKRKESFEDVVATVVRAFVGLIYQEQGIHAARNFVHSYFLSRHLDFTSLFNFKNPKYILSGVIAKHLATAGVQPGTEETRIESRLLASTGTSSQAPLFNIGLFLPSGLKLAEGHGSSLKMAEHRAAVNALHSLFLIRTTPEVLPTQVHDLWTITDGNLSRGEVFEGDAEVKGEAVVGSSRRGVRR